MLGNINKTLNVVKKSIPVYKEIRPYINKEKSLFKTTEKSDISNKPNKENNYNDNLTFFN
jgi:hypothetical protein